MNAVFRQCWTLETLAPASSTSDWYCAPAYAHTSRSPDASTTTLARIARRPCLLSNSTPRTAPSSTSVPTTQECSSSRTPSSSSRFAETSLSHSGSIIGERVTVSRNALRRSPQCATSSGSVEPHCSGGGPATASAGRRSRISEPKPVMTWLPSQSVMRSIQMTRPPVESPPRWLWRSTSVTCAPSRRAAIAAAQPAGPPPTTSTSVSSCTGVSRAGSCTVRAGCSRRSRRAAPLVNQLSRPAW